MWHGCDGDIREPACNHDDDEGGAVRRLSHMSASELLVLRKLCLLHLTSIMDTHSPLHQTATNWYDCTTFYPNRFHWTSFPVANVTGKLATS